MPLLDSKGAPHFSLFLPSYIFVLVGKLPIYFHPIILLPCTAIAAFFPIYHFTIPLEILISCSSFTIRSYKL